MKKIVVIMCLIIFIIASYSGCKTDVPPITTSKITIMVNDFKISLKRLTKEEFILLDSRVTSQVIQNAVSFAILWESFQKVSLEVNNIIDERKLKRRVLKE